jgi:hypothetical protein
MGLLESLLGTDFPWQTVLCPNSVLLCKIYYNSHTLRPITVYCLLVLSNTHIVLNDPEHPHYFNDDKKSSELS